MKILQLNDVCYNAGESPILNNVNLSVDMGDFLTITGPSGGGKSTLLKLLNSLISPASGEIIYRNKSLFDYNPVELRKDISLCFQTPYLFGDTVMDNMSFPFNIRKLPPDMHLIKETLSLFNFREDILDKNIRDLSGGEVQRIALARQLLFKPDVLLLDEVTSALDEANALIIEQSVKDLNNQGVTVLWITHSNPQAKRLGNRNVYVEGGNAREVRQ